MAIPEGQHSIRCPIDAVLVSFLVQYRHAFHLGKGRKATASSYEEATPIRCPSDMVHESCHYADLGIPLACLLQHPDFT
eukprot:5100097-Amphidinium_carterae.1